MASETKQSLVLRILLLASTYLLQVVHGQRQVACLFIFGDSLSDSGNNNDLSTAAKVNYPPYGIDFPNGPIATGRFTNGRTAIDFITQYLGFEDFIPPFANTTGSDILKGVNYASGSAGIRNESGTQLGDNVNLDEQLENHRIMVSQISSTLGGPDQALEYLNQCLYYVNIGSNDYINNYFMPESFPTSSTYNIVEYAEVLIQQLSQRIRVLHDNLGARKFVLNGLGLIGCTPQEISTHGILGTLCVLEQNNAVIAFNAKLRLLVDQLNQELSDANFIYVDNVAISAIYPLSGFTEINDECCPVRGDGQCVPNETPCQNRRQYVFYDGFHPTEAANEITATSSYNASNPLYTYPMDINHVLQLQVS
ncbi:hypothetical protein L6164_035399 [Bauhinia variegata]|uniref:Uncharacterized protein n=1 Tax=Bauhinia variegata TaxID=167791 RepID=A0ACB9KDU8_BAUVA|nr:hypothetical protein L6164_035399 [Bauhinia variegata]